MNCDLCYSEDYGSVLSLLKLNPHDVKAEPSLLSASLSPRCLSLSSIKMNSLIKWSDPTNQVLIAIRKESFASPTDDNFDSQCCPGVVCVGNSGQNKILPSHNPGPTGAHLAIVNSLKSITD